MRVIGVDPGTLRCGYGIVMADSGRLWCIDYGVIRLSPRVALAERLLLLYNNLKKILKAHAPECASVEKVFFARNVRAAFSLGYARAVVLLCLAEEGVPIAEYSAAEIKKAVTGYGRADKHQIQKMVQNILNLKTLPEPDMADALAMAICHINTNQTFQV